LKIERVQGGWLERVLLPGRQIPDPSLLRTHPETSDRIRRLMALKPAVASRPVWETVEGGTDLDNRPHRTVVRPARWHITGLWH
jgi:heat shock protein HtpX